jgi:serine/threonine-protein kinase RsbW
VPSLTVRADPASLSQIRGWLDSALSALGVTENVRADLALAVTELCTNIIRHGYRGAEGPIELRAARDDDTIEITATDKAPAFSPEEHEAAGPRALLREGGYGLDLIKAMADEVSHTPLPEGGNRVTLIKRLPPAT